MVDAIVSLAAQELTDFLTQEATFLLGVKDDLEAIKHELIWMQSFLEDAEQKQGNDKRIRQWIADIRNVAYKTEDIIDDFKAEVKGEKPSKRKLLTTSLQKFLCIAGETNVYDIGKEIKELKERLSDIKSKREAYGISDIVSTLEIPNAKSQNDLWEKRRTTFLTDEEFVGFDDDVKLLETQLFLSELSRRVVSIWGMGGLGKTSLARNLYNTNKGRFNLHGWVCVSQEWNTKDLLARIIKSLKELTNEELMRLEMWDANDMKRYLHELLNNKRYLVVIDDMWHEEAWDCLRSVLPDNQNGSRVIITTRNESVAKLSDNRTYVHQLRRLREDESWELFCKKAFSNRNSACPEDLEKIGKEMVAKCDGLPLAIIVLGGLLSWKEPHEWIDIKQRIWKALIDRSIHISALLDLSYSDLSPKLKSCFLYLGFFPEDYVIRSEKLIHLWIAEDLIQAYEGQDLEELAESYIKELNARSLIQLSYKHYYSTSTCRVHDLLRDLAVNKAKELDFFHIYGESVNPATKPSSTRRIAFRSGFERYTASDDHSHTQVHTLSFLNYYDSCLNDDDVTKLLTLINTRFKSLRVLDLEGVKIKTPESKQQLFTAMGKLVHLRYLGLFDTGIDELPESIGNLQALQVLDGLSGCSLLLPRGMYKLKQLRHLKGSFITFKGSTWQQPIPLEDELTNLRTLHHIDTAGWAKYLEVNERSFVLKVFSNLTNIRNLSVDIPLRGLTSIEPLFNCKNLIELSLSGTLMSLPMELHEALPKLRYLYLYRAKFGEDPLPALEKLPNLLVLGLSGFEVDSMIITATGFCKLLTLKIRDFPKNMNLQIEKGALPSLRHIQIDPLKNFTLPERLKNLPK